jgi:hypothetical protein
VIGANQDPYLNRGDWQLNTSFRWLRSFRHFSGTEEQVDREKDKNNVVNRQQVLDLGATYAIDRQTNVSLSVPILIYGSWSIPLPIRPDPGPRYTQSAEGLGDITLSARRWVLDCEHNHRGNVLLGLGLKLPTGNYNAKDRFPDITGGNPRVKPVDQSIQPGDGGVGLVLDMQAFKSWGDVTAYANASYLINPRDTNGTPSILANLLPTIPPASRYRAVNSVPDQYLARAGVAVPIKKARGLSVLLGARIEGVPVEDLFGDSNGFRRPGYAIFVEPGLVYTRGNDTFSITAPVATQRNRPKDYADVEGDATFADYVILVGYSHRFGKKK